MPTRNYTKRITRTFIAMALSVGFLFGQSIPTPSIPGPRSSCLPVGVAGPQLPLCFASASPSANGTPVVRLALVAGGLTASYFLQKYMRHRRERVASK